MSARVPFRPVAVLALIALSALVIAACGAALDAQRSRSTTAIAPAAEIVDSGPDLGPGVVDAGVPIAQSWLDGGLALPDASPIFPIETTASRATE